MDSRKYEVRPNDDSTSSFLYKITEVVTYDSGHKSISDIDYFRDIHSATLTCEELNQRETK